MGPGTAPAAKRSPRPPLKPRDAEPPSLRQPKEGSTEAHIPPDGAQSLPTSAESPGYNKGQAGGAPPERARLWQGGAGLGEAAGTGRGMGARGGSYHPQPWPLELAEPRPT